MRVALRRARRGDERRAHAITSPKNEVPAASGATPKYSATVAPRSAKLRRSPNATGFTRGPSTNTGTASREWSVDGVVGSLP